MQFYSDRVTDQYGNVKASASVRVLLNGSLATIYSDDGITTKANPITTGSDGSFSFYAANGTYTLSVSGAQAQTVTLLDYTDVSTAVPSGSATVLGEDGGTVKRFNIAQAVPVTYFGVVGDGSADDTDALNLAGDWLRDQIAAAGGNHAVKLILPYGLSIITEGGWNLTNIRSGTSDGLWSIENHGATITGHCTGKPVLDLMRSLGGTVRGVHIIGDSTNRPRMGIQLARGTTGESADLIKLEDVKVEGYHTLAALYNMASERFLAHRCSFINMYAGAECFAVVIDGRNKYAAVSDYYTTTIAADTAQSCLSHLFQQTTCYNGGSGPAIFHTRASRVEFRKSYAVSADSCGVRIGYDGNPVRDLTYDLHMETTGTLTSAFEFTSEAGAGAATIHKFSWYENASQATNSIFNADGVTVKITDGDVSIGSYGVTPTAVAAGSAFKFYGKFSSSVAAPFGTAELMVGFHHTVNYSVVGYRFTTGSFTLTDEQSGDRIVKGTHRFYGATADTFLGNSLASKHLVKVSGGKVFLGATTTGNSNVLEIGDSGTEAAKFWLNLFGSGAQLRLQYDLGGANTDLLTFNAGGNGTIRLPRLAADPGSGNTGGDIYYNTATDKLRVYVGGGTAAWVDLH
jgi:hypothetical protein